MTLSLFTLLSRSICPWGQVLGPEDCGGGREQGGEGAWRDRPLVLAPRIRVYHPLRPPFRHLPGLCDFCQTWSRRLLGVRRLVLTEPVLARPLPLRLSLDSGEGAVETGRQSESRWPICEGYISGWGWTSIIRSPFCWRNATLVPLRLCHHHTLRGNFPEQSGSETLKYHRVSFADPRSTKDGHEFRY